MMTWQSAITESAIKLPGISIKLNIGKIVIAGD